MVITPKGDPVLLFAGLTYMHKVLEQVSWIRDTRNVVPVDPRAAALPHGRKDFGSEVRKILDERGAGRGRVCVMGGTQMPLGLWKVLTASLPEDRFDLSLDPLADLRAIKSPGELALLRHAACICDMGYKTLVETTRPGMRGYEVVAEMERTARYQGADFAKYWFISGPSEGWKDTWPIVSPHERKLQQGDQIICGSYVVYKGYWAHGMRNGTLGRSPQHDGYIPAAMAVHEAALRAFRPGASVSDVVKAAKEAGQAHGFELNSPRIGHGIGMDYAEKPFLTDTNEEVLQPGMVAVIHPQLTLPETGEFIVPLGDVCAVTEEGMELLYKFPMEPFRI
jgi:Xaa-Pro aminopeptidase